MANRYWQTQALGHTYLVWLCNFQLKGMLPILIQEAQALRSSTLKTESSYRIMVNDPFHFLDVQNLVVASAL